jgi:POTRA domain-containing FtsQ-type protein
VTPAYQGRALLRETLRRRPSRLVLVVRMLTAVAVVVVLAHLPWEALRRRVAVVSDVRVEGLHYLDAARVLAHAGLRRGMDLFDVDRGRARQSLLADSRIAAARIDWVGPRVLRVTVRERQPVLLVRHGSPWELDGGGVLLEPLGAGVVADVPLLAGPSFDRLPAGALVDTAPVRRGLAWARAVSDRDLELARRVSEIDVSDPTRTGLLLMNGTRVVCPTDPPGRRTLSALRVVLADLEQRKVLAQEVDVRFQDQVIVRPAKGAPTNPDAGPTRTETTRRG